jgi:hypothetical protein
MTKMFWMFPSVYKCFSKLKVMTLGLGFVAKARAFEGK